MTASAVFQPGRVLVTAWRVWLRNAYVFVPLALLVDMPWRQYVSQQLTQPVLQAWGPRSYALIELVSAVGSVVVQVLVVSGSLAVLAGRSVGSGGGFPAGAAALPRSVIVGLAALCPASGVAWLSQWASADLWVAASIISGLIGWWVTLALWVAVPVAVVEGRRFPSALTRSWLLTRGARWRLLALAIVLVLLRFGASYVPMDDLWSWGVWATIGSFGAVLVASSYVELRRAAEGYTTSELDAIFG